MARSGALSAIGAPNDPQFNVPGVGRLDGLARRSAGDRRNLL